MKILTIETMSRKTILSKQALRERHGLNHDNFPKLMALVYLQFPELKFKKNLTREEFKLCDKHLCRVRYV